MCRIWSLLFNSSSKILSGKGPPDLVKCAWPACGLLTTISQGFTDPPARLVGEEWSPDGSERGRREGSRPSESVASVSDLLTTMHGVHCDSENHPLTVLGKVEDSVAPASDLLTATHQPGRLGKRTSDG